MFDDVKKRVAVMKFIGEVLSKPDKFRDEFKFTVNVATEQEVVGIFTLRGDLAKFFREVGGVQGTVETRDQIEAR